MPGDKVQHFRQTLSSETSRLSILCRKWTDVIDSEEVPEDVKGQARTAIGLAQLLTSNRFHQFSGLIDNCEFKLGEKETTCDDLSGFWDMVYFQVEDVNRKFASLDKLQGNHWVAEESHDKKSRVVVAKKRQPFKSVSRMVNIEQHAAAARQRLAIAKARATKSTDSVSDTDDKENLKTFEMPGFFVISSPVKIHPQRKQSALGDGDDSPFSASFNM